jgi:hypothetical protein
LLAAAAALRSGGGGDLFVFGCVLLVVCGGCFGCGRRRERDLDGDEMLYGGGGEENPGGGGGSYVGEGDRSDTM